MLQTHASLAGGGAGAPAATARPCPSACTHSPLPSQVVHNPSTLEKVTPGMRDEDSQELRKAAGAKQRSKRGRSSGGSKAAGAEPETPIKKAGRPKRAAAAKKGAPAMAPTKKRGAGGKKRKAAAAPKRSSRKQAR